MSFVTSYDNFTYVLNDPVFYHTIPRGESEPYPFDLAVVKKYLEQFPHKNRTYIDVGAHIGTTILPYSRLFKRCIGYEANPINFDFCKTNIKNNNVLNATVKNVAVSNEIIKGSMVLHSGGNSGCFYFKKDDNGNINSVCLDDETDLECVDFIKIDTEGSELNVLKSAEKMLRRDMPLIQVEINNCSKDYFNISSNELVDYLYSLGYVLFNDAGSNKFFYYPKNIYCFWTGDNEMSSNRKECLSELKRVSECNVILVKKGELDKYILPNYPLHPAYEYLSETHKADYLRTYFMNFYGGGYSDVKKTTGSWINSFNNFLTSDSWICGYKEINGGVAVGPNNRELVEKWNELVGNGSYICKPHTPLTEEWYSEMIALLDTKLDTLKKFPSTHPRDSDGSGSGYPIGWNEMLGQIFHRVCYKYKDRLMNILPILDFCNYI